MWHRPFSYYYVYIYTDDGRDTHGRDKRRQQNVVTTMTTRSTTADHC
jgi:hypothetical protein